MLTKAFIIATFNAYAVIVISQLIFVWDVLYLESSDCGYADVFN